MLCGLSYQANWELATVAHFKDYTWTYFPCCFRFEIVKLLESLWKRPDCLPSILGECGRESFQV